MPAGLSPLAAATWLVEHQRDYLRGVEGHDFATWAASMPDSQAQQVLAVGRGLTRAWASKQQAELGPVDAERPGAWIARAAESVDRILVSPFEFPFSGERQWFANARIPHFADGTASRLLRGSTNCDGYAHLLGSVLVGWTRAELMRLRHAHHRLLRLPKLARVGAAVWLDTYAGFPAFVLGPARADLATLDQVRALAAAPDSNRALGDRPSSERGYQSANRVLKLAQAPAVEWPRGLAPPHVEAGRVELDLEGRYYLARAEHLFGDPQRARDMYAAVAGEDQGDRPGPEGTVRSLARRFGRRLG